jgi:predicted TIM-barrel fold metal-dependent hydrolase
LLSGSEDERLNRNIKRLNALGVDFQLSEADNEISNIIDRANNAQNQINPHLKEPSTSKDGYLSLLNYSN